MSDPSRWPRSPARTDFHYKSWTGLYFRVVEEEVFVYHLHPLTRSHDVVGTVPRGLWAVWTWAEREEYGMSYLRNPAASAPGDGDDPGAVLADWASRFPACLEYMTARKTPDGRPREVATLMLVADEDGLKGCLNDRQTGHQLWVTSDTVDGLIAALEAALTSPRPNWRRSKWAGKDQKKK